ncbi:hypothetical protein [Erythrobacter aureus]|uniref:Copper-binding protein n=1 Tax=Erythrobacter aureus TaxID=2182384 RepID=A0A345YIV1_9SPHN|nr:hypothetical protein [Erythrobacter aureus]AXK43853.1 hypothetical protein DVR09_15475 [Erythrobacter aureus]
MTNARRFSPIFVATVTPASIATGTAKNGNDYAKMQGATVQQDGKADKTMTVMAFGDQHAEVADHLIEGQPVDLAVQYDGGSLKVIGLPRAKAA